jgi:HSP20 family protein
MVQEPKNKNRSGEIQGSGKQDTEKRSSERERNVTQTSRGTAPERSGGGSMSVRGPVRSGPGRSQSPFALMSQLSQEMDRIFDDFWGAPYGGMQQGRMQPRRGESGLASGLWMPEIEVHAHEGEIVVRADLPGLSKDDVQVDVTDRMLTIQGERRQECEDEHDGGYRTEVRYGSFRRTIPLPEGVDPERIEAQFEDGVLQIKVPTPDRRQSQRRIEVRGGERTAGTSRSGQGQSPRGT